MYNNFNPYYYLPYRQQQPSIQIDQPTTPEYEGATGAGGTGPMGSVYQPPGPMMPGGWMQGTIIPQPGSPWNGSIYTDDTDPDDETVDEPVMIGGTTIPQWNGWSGGGPTGGPSGPYQMYYGPGSGMSGSHNPGYHNPGYHNPCYYNPCSCYYFGRPVIGY